MLGALELYTIYLGDRLGLYRALHEERATSGELAAQTGTNERYVVEWLEHHAASGLLEVDVATDPLAPARWARPPRTSRGWLTATTRTLRRLPGNRRSRAPPARCPILLTRSAPALLPRRCQGSRGGPNRAAVRIWLTWATNGCPRSR